MLIFTLHAVSASDVNETVDDDYTFICDTVVCEDEIADGSLNSPGNEITLENENSVADIVIDNNETTSFEIVNNIEYNEEECGLDTENSEKDIYIDFYNNGQFCDINIISDEKLDATFNNISITSFVILNSSLDDIECFEIFLIKMEDFDSESFKEGKFKNSFAFKQELMLHVLNESNFENYMDCNIIICSNKATDNFAYSINNSVIDDESSVIYCIFTSSYFINQNYLLSNFNSYFFSVSIFSSLKNLRYCSKECK